MAQVARKNTVNTPANDEQVQQEQQPAVRVIEAVMPSGKYQIREMNTEAADKAIADILTTGKRLRKLAHEAACGVMLHYAEHGDYTRLQRENDKQAPRLLEAIEASMSRSMARAFVDWVVKFSSLRYNEETKRFYHNKRDKRIPDGKAGFFGTIYTTVDGVETAIDPMAEGNEFFRLEREPAAPKPLSIEELLAAFVKRAETLLEQKTEGVERNGRKLKIKHDISPEIVNDLRTFATAHGVKLDEE